MHLIYYHEIEKMTEETKIRVPQLWPSEREIMPLI